MGILFHTIHNGAVENFAVPPWNRDKKRFFDNTAVENPVENVEKPKFPHQDKRAECMKKNNWDFAQNKKTLPLDSVLLQIFTTFSKTQKSIFCQKTTNCKNIKKSRNQKKFVRF